jgi:uncharacterized membrane protein YfcA
MSGPETIFHSIPQFLGTCLVLVFAQTVYVAFGFGVGLIVVGALALFFAEIRDVVVLLFFISAPAELYVVGRAWHLVPWRGVLPIAAGLLVGIPLGTALLRLGEPTFLLTALGVVLIGSGGAFLAAAPSSAGRLPGWVAPPTGLVSGVLSGLFGTGGPPLILYYQATGTDKATFRRCLMALFLMTSMVRLVAYVAAGLLTAPRVLSGLAVLPAAVLGAFIGQQVHLQLSEATFRRLVSLALIAIGMLLLARQLT